MTTDPMTGPASPAAIEPKQYVAEYQGKSVSELREALESLLTVGAETFARMAAIVLVADERGLTGELGLQGYQVLALRRIGRGQVLPAAYARFGATPLGRYLNTLSVALQRSLADGGTVPVYSFRNGRVEKREVQPLKLTDFERRQVFGAQGIRDAAEQRSWLESLRKRRRDSADGNVIVDRANHALIVRVGDSEVSLSRDDLLDYIKQI